MGMPESPTDDTEVDAGADTRIRQILSGPEGPAIGAFFDFDGTLIDGFSASAYFKERLRRRQLGLDELADLLSFLRHPEPDTAAFARLLAATVRPLKGMAELAFRDTWTRLFQQEIAGNIFPEAWRLVQAHQRMGHTVAIASSATTAQVAPVAAEFRIEHCLTSRLEVSEGLLTGRVDGIPLWGPAKAAAVRSFAKARGIQLDSSHAYANGDEDRDFLAAVGRPLAVNPGPRLAAEAVLRTWPIARFASRRGASLSHKLRTVGAYGAMAASFAGALLYDRLTGERRRAMDLAASIGSELGLAIAGIQLRIQGEEHLWSQRPAVFIFNHQSPLDLVVGCRLAQRGFTGVVKKEAAQVPGFGQFLKFADMAFVDRGDAIAARKALAPAVEKLRRGISVGICPEGTRSYSPRLGAFKKGAFHLAMQAGVPIVPVVLRNVGECMSRNGAWMRPGIVDIAVLPPISVHDWRLSELDVRIAEVRQQFIDTLLQWPLVTENRS